MNHLEKVEQISKLYLDYNRVQKHIQDLEKYLSQVVLEDKPIYISLFTDKRATQDFNYPTLTTPFGEMFTIPVNQINEFDIDKRSEFSGLKLEYKICQKTAIKFAGILMESKKEQLEIILDRLLLLDIELDA